MNNEIAYLLHVTLVLLSSHIDSVPSIVYDPSQVPECFCVVWLGVVSCIYRSADELDGS